MYVFTAVTDAVTPLPLYGQVLLNIMLFAFGALASGIFFYNFGQNRRKKFAEAHIKSAEDRAAEILNKADTQRNEIIRASHVEGKQIAADYRTREEEYIKKKENEIKRKEQEINSELKIRRQELAVGENRINQKEQNLEKKIEKLEARDKAIDKKEEEIKARFAELESLRRDELVRLEKISGYNQEEAKAELLNALDNELEVEKAKRIYYANEQAKSEADATAQFFIADAMAMSASDTVAEIGATIVHINEEQKGALIGREGRNIKAIENAIGASVIIEDTPCVAMISTHDLRRREIGKRLIETLLREGGIQPSKIEDTAKNIENNINALMRKKADEAALKAKVSGINSKLMEYIGKLYFRTSYGQNVLAHAIEVANFASTLAGELGANSAIARRAGFLHDIGKAIEGAEGSHATNGAELCERYHENPEVVHAIASHHKDIEVTSAMDLIIRIADTLSAGRPGARNTSSDDYIRRISELEDICKNFDGVDKAFAFQSGREVRVIVDPRRISDAAMNILARNIANKIQTDLRYPGQIKVHVIREKREEVIAK